MNTAILFSTKHGSSARCAEILAEKAKGEVTVVNVKEKPGFSLDGYDTVILGASVYINKIQKEMSLFCSRNSGGLLKKKLGLYICSGARGEQGLSYLKLFGEDLYAHAEVKNIFGDEVHWEDMNCFEKLITRIVSKKKTSSSNLEMDNIQSFVEQMEL